MHLWGKKKKVGAFTVGAQPASHSLLSCCGLYFTDTFKSKLERFSAVSQRPDSP